MINKTFRLFISSTFSDFLTERSLLNHEIFRDVEAYCRAQGYHFQLIDLRWGVNTESALNQQTISICLDEVRRCRTLSPRPNFLILSGERYGWIPLPPRMEKERFDALLGAAEGEETALLQRWYEEDDNACGGEWYLKSRAGAFVDDARWAEEESALRRAMLSAASRCGWTEKELAVLDTSATEQEIMAGFLGDSDGSDNVIAVLRRGYPHRDADAERALALQDRIAAAMENDGNADSVLRLTWGDSYEELFRRLVTEKLLENIREEIERLDALERSRKESFAVTAEGIFHGRERELAALEQYMAGNSDALFFLWGDSGSGKTTLLRRCAAERKENVFFATFGMDERSYTLSGVLKRLQRWCEGVSGVHLPAFGGPAELMDRIVTTLKGCEGRWVIILDALDMYHDLETVRESFLPRHLPETVRIIVSAAEKERVEPFIPQNAERLGIEAFDRQECGRLFDSLLAQKGRRVTPAGQRKAVEAVFADGATPLQVKLTAELAGRWHSGDGVADLPVTAEETALLHMEGMYRAFGHARCLTLYALALIAVSPQGITEEELQVLLPRFEDVKRELDAEDRYTSGLTKLPFVVWSRLFYDLSGCLTLEKLAGAIVVKFTHQVFYRAFSAAYADHCLAAAEKLRTFYLSQPDYLNREKRLPNVRKVLSLLSLLNGEELAELLGEISFTDACLHAAGAEETIRMLRRGAECAEESCRKNLVSLLSCMLDHRAMLSCYPHAFLRRCAERGLCRNEGAGILLTKTAKESGQQVFFPYSAEAQVWWQEETNRFAISQGNYVFLCDGESGSELMRIYLSREKEDEINLDQPVCLNFCWLGTDAVLCCAGRDRAEVYDISGDIPRLRYRLGWNEKSRTVAYSRSTGVLLLTADDDFCAVDPGSGECLWSYDIKKGKDFSFSLSEDEREVSFKNKPNYIRVHDVASGDLIHLVRHQAGNRAKEQLARGNQFSVNQGREGRWLIYDNDGNGMDNTFILHEQSKKKSCYLLPPLYHRLRGIVCSGDAVVLIYQDTLVWMDLGDLKMSAWEGEDIRRVSWAERGKRLSVITGHGMFLVKRELFVPMGVSAVTVRDDLSAVLPHAKDQFRLLGGMLGSLARMLGGLGSFWNYPFYFMDAFSSDANMALHNQATLVSFAPDGKMAVAYEGADALCVFDEKGEKLVFVDRLALGIQDNILRMIFSPDSKYLLLWRNRSVVVLNVLEGWVTQKVCLRAAPALSVEFADDDLYFVLCDGSSGLLPFGGRKVTLSRGIGKDDYDYYGPYAMEQQNGKAVVHPYVDVERLSVMGSCKNWLKTDRIYGDLVFKDGVFTLDGQRLDASGMDFSAALELERQADDRDLDTYLREKNDLSYGLYPVGTGHLLLVSPLLSSVLLIDKEGKRIVDAYRHHAPIIGHRMRDEAHLELVSAQGAARTELEILV